MPSCRDVVPLRQFAAHSHTIGERPDNTALDAERDRGAIAAERSRLENELQACTASLRKIEMDLQSLDIQRSRLDDPGLTDAAARLREVAGMSIELRTALHAIIGYAQLFRNRSGLDAVQTEWLDAMLAAGIRLIGDVDCVIGMAEGRAALDADGHYVRPPDAGMTMHLAAAPDVVPPGGQFSTAPAAGSAGLRVMIVDDDKMNRQVAAAFMRSSGHTVEAVEAGEKAVALAAVNDFDVVVMDLRMPDMDGLEATRRIRAIPGARGQVPILALTACADSLTVAACQAAGMNGNLVKPFRLDTLNDAIVAAASRYRPSPGGKQDPLRGGHYAAAESAGGHELAAASPVPANQGWVDVACSWNPILMRAQRALANPAVMPAPNTPFRVKLTAIGMDRHRQLVPGSVRSCQPPPDCARHEFHWLLFADTVSPEVCNFTTSCELWRWSDSLWKSIVVQGAHFPPDEMFEQGWRYCGPCFEQTATVDIV